jgi:hypothetical protein
MFSRKLKTGCIPRHSPRPRKSHPHLANGAAAPVGLGLRTRRFSRPCTKNAAFEISPPIPRGPTNRRRNSFRVPLQNRRGCTAHPNRTTEASHPHLANGAAAPLGQGLRTRRFSRPCTKNAAFEIPPPIPQGPTNRRRNSFRVPLQKSRRLRRTLLPISVYKCPLDSLAPTRLALRAACGSLPRTCPGPRYHL